jgi:hypothetical protein
VKQSQHELYWLGLQNQQSQRIVSPHHDTQEYIFQTKTRCCNRIATTYGAPYTCPQPHTCCPFISIEFHQANIDFIYASHMPPQTWVFSHFPKTSQNIQPLATCLPILETLLLVRCLKLALQISCQNSLCPPLVVRLLFYMDSQRQLSETSHLFGVIVPLCKSTLNRTSHPFLDPVCASKPCVPFNHSSLGSMHPILGHVHTPFILRLFMSDHHDSSWMCRWGHSTSSVHPCC